MTRHPDLQVQSVPSDVVCWLDRCETLRDPFKVTIKTLRELRDRTPFKSFELHLSSGQTLPVVSTDHLFFFPTHSELMVVLPDGGFRFVDPGHVVSAGPSSKGRRKMP